MKFDTKGVGGGLCHRVPTHWCANYKLRVECGRIDHFVRGLKPEIREQVVVDLFNKGGRWEDFERLDTYAVVLSNPTSKRCERSHLSLVVLSARTRHMARP